MCPVVGPLASFQRRHPALLRSLGGFCFLEDPCPSVLAGGLYSGLCPQLHPHCPNPEQVLGKCLMKLWLKGSTVLTLDGQGLEHYGNLALNPQSFFPGDHSGYEYLSFERWSCARGKPLCSLSEASLQAEWSSGCTSWKSRDLAPKPQIHHFPSPPPSV